MSDWWAAPNELREAEAVDWYRRSSPFSPSALDSAVVALESSFGPLADVAAVAPVDALTDRPSLLFLAISGDIADDETWSRLVEAHRTYHPANAGPVGNPLRDEAYDRLRLVVARIPEARPLREASDEWFRR
jgi:hypothetical protein